MTIVTFCSAVFLLPLLASVPAGATHAQQTAPPASSAAALSLADYIAHLDALSATVRAGSADDRATASRLLSELPREWVVATPDQTWRVSTGGLGSALADWRTHRAAPQHEAVLASLAVMRTQANAFSRVPSNSAQARARLADVLSAKEFRDVSGPSALDRLRRRVVAWVTDLLSSLFGTSVVPMLASIGIYVVIGLAILAGALVMIRAFRRKVRSEIAELELAAEPARAWDDWLRQARVAAADGHWAEAIRLSYWCGIAFLESRGAWPPDSSRTPREYLALVSSAPPAAGLRSLTGLLERSWYGQATADASSFDEAVGCLRSMGCPVD